MSNEKKGELITSVKSGNGLKILSGLEARAKMDNFGFDNLYYLDIDYKDQAQADYMQEKYGNEYSYGNNEYMQYWGCVNAETDNQKTGSFITTEKMLFKNLVYHFINDEKMTQVEVGQVPSQIGLYPICSFNSSVICGANGFNKTNNKL